MSILRAAAALIIALIAALCLMELPALADDPCQNPLTHQACASAKDGRIKIGASKRRQEPGRIADGASGTNSWVAIAAAYCGDATANATSAAAAPQAVVDICRGFAALPGGPGREDVVRAFKELPLYRGAIRTEPRRWTLVHFETSFWCGDAEGRTCDLVGGGEKKLTLLGQPVRIRPKIVDYSWDFGDGTTAQVTGRAAHTYAHAGDRTVTLTLTWTADYALGTGAFQPIDDTTTTTSPPRLLPVREAQTVIVEGDR